MKKVSLLAAVAALAIPGSAAATQQSGVVVKVDRRSHVIAVAQNAGQVVRVHAPVARFDRTGKQFHVGQRLTFTARKLGNGSVTGSGFRVTGRAGRVTVHGIVRAYNVRKRSITLATDGGLLRMKLARTGARTLMAATPPPKVGDEVTVTASVDENDDALEATEVDDQADDQQAEDQNDQQAEDQNDQQAQGDEQQAEQGDQAEQDDQDAEGDNSGSGGGSGDDSSAPDEGSGGSGSGDDGGGD